MLMSFQAILLPFLFFMSRSLLTKSSMMNSCFPQAGTCPFQRQLAKSSALCYQSSTTGKVSYDQQRKGTETRKAKEVLWDAWRVPWWAQTLADVVLPCNFSHSTLQGCTVMENHARYILPGILSVICAFDFAPLGTGKALYIFQLKQAEKEDKLTFKYYFN